MYMDNPYVSICHFSLCFSVHYLPVILVIVYTLILHGLAFANKAAQVQCEASREIEG